MEKKKYLWTYNVTGFDKPAEDCRIFSGDRLPDVDIGERWEATEFGDYWYRAFKKPEIDSNGLCEFDIYDGEPIQCRVTKRDNAWICTPILPVYILMRDPSGIFDWVNDVRDAIRDRIGRELTNQEQDRLYEENWWPEQFEKSRTDKSHAADNATIQFLGLEKEAKF